MPNNEKPRRVLEKQIAGDSEALSAMGRAGGREAAKRRELRKKMAEMEAEADEIEQYLQALKENRHLAPLTDDENIVLPATPEEIEDLRERYEKLTGRHPSY